MTYNIIKFLLKVISIIPFGMLYSISSMLYVILYYVIRYRRNTVFNNLQESFPDKSKKEIKRIEKRFYHYFADNIVEICKMWSMSDDEMRGHIKFINVDDINEKLRKGKSVALYLGHYANWEWISSLPLNIDKNIICGQIYHRLSNPDIDKIMQENRTWNGSVNIEMRETARHINRLSMENKVYIIGFIADQSPRKKDARHYIPFLNHEIPVQIATEKIIRHYEMDAWFVRPKRIKRGFYEAEFIHMDDTTTKDRNFGLTETYFRLLEETIYQNPEFYLWTHRRFRLSKRILS